MARWLFHIAAAIALLLCLATAALWPRTYWYNDATTWERNRVMSGVITWRGQLRVYQIDGSADLRGPGTGFRPRWFATPWNRVTPPFSGSDAVRKWEFPKSSGDPSDSTTRAGVEWFQGAWYILNDDSIVPHPAWALTIPLAYPFALFAVIPIVWLFARRPFESCRRKRLGLCLTCGYDLRAHRPGQRCPECGTIVPSPASSPLVPQRQ